MPSHHGTQPGPEEEGLSSVDLLAPTSLALPQFPCGFFSENQRHQVSQSHGEPGFSWGLLGPR